jgi:hypothetical protein
MSDSPIQTVLDHLKRVRRHEKGDGWEACCPAHEDKKPSLGIAVGDDGRVLLCCQAGCPVEAIVKAIGLTMADLFPGESNGKPRIVATYDYCDEAGVLRYQTVRFCPKDFRQRRPDGRGGWIWNLKGVNRLLYRLPELLASPIAETVFGCEGEKDADNVARLGLTATCNPLGAGKWMKCYNEALRGRPVVLLPHNDPAGRAHMADVRRHLDGVAASVKILTLPDLPDRGDVSDWLAAGGTKERLLEMAAATSQEDSRRNPPKQPKKRGFVRRAQYKPFPVDALPPILNEYVAASVAAIGCDAAMVSLPALAVIAAAIGNSRVIRLKRNWSEPAVVWSATLARSGEQKSPGWDVASGPYTAIQMELIRAALVEKEEYGRRLEEWKERDKNARGPKPARPADARTITTTDSTIWTLGELMRDNPKGILLSRDELDGWLQGFTRFTGGKSTDRPHWLELSRAGPLLIDRISRDKGKLAVSRAACSITGTIQPLILARSITDEDLAAGLLARILLANPPRRRKRWTDNDVSAEQAKNYEHLLRTLLDLRLQDEDKREPHYLVLEDSAKKTWIDWYNHWADRQFNSQAEQAAVLAKLEGYAARLALIHHVVTLASEDCKVLHPISNRSLEAGIKLARWFADEAIRVYQILRLTTDEQDQRELVEWIESLGDSTTARNLCRSWHGRYPAIDDAESALNDLVNAGLGEWEVEEAGPQGGRPTSVFHLCADETPENCGDFEVSSAQDSEREPGQEG